VHRRNMKEMFMESPNSIAISVETNKAASRLCQRLFSSWSRPPTQGELQRVIIESWRLGGSEEEIINAGNWWLWARDLAIENTFNKQTRLQMMEMAIRVSMGEGKIHFVSARSPELVHAQVLGQGDTSLPRSRKALAKMAELCRASEKFLPTELTIVFADLAIDNLTAIIKSCNLEEIIRENISRVRGICQELGLSNFQVIGMSELRSPHGQLSDFLNLDGSPKVSITLGERASKLVEIATRESFESHQRMFGWSKEQSATHNTNLAITMGLVGSAVQLLNPPPILIHNESFISRGSLNNLFTDPKKPLPVICLRDLLEIKRLKEGK